MGRHRLERHEHSRGRPHTIHGAVPTTVFCVSYHHRRKKKVTGLYFVRAFVHEINDPTIVVALGEWAVDTGDNRWLKKFYGAKLGHAKVLKAEREFAGAAWLADWKDAVALGQRACPAVARVSGKPHLFITEPSSTEVSAAAVENDAALEVVGQLFSNAKKVHSHAVEDSPAPTRQERVHSSPRACAT